MTQPPDTSVAQGTNRDFAAVAGLFIGNGLAVGVLGGSLPGLRAHLDLEPGQIVGVLVAAAVVAVFSMNLSGAVSDRIGARLPALVGGVVMAMGAVVMGFAPNYVVLIVGAAVFGLGNGAHGRGDERARRQRRAGPAPAGDEPAARELLDRQLRGRPAGRRARLAGRRRVAAAGRCGAAPCWPSYSSARLRASRPQSRRRVASADGGGRGPIPPGIWLLAAMAVCFGLTEGTAIDWSSLHVTDVGDVSPSAGAWGLACVSGFMVVIRLFGDTVVERVGRVAVVRFGAVCALLGYVLTAFTSALPVILVGWCLVGLGVGLLAPQIYGLAGHIGGGAGPGASWSASGTPPSWSARP